MLSVSTLESQSQFTPTLTYSEDSAPDLSPSQSSNAAITPYQQSTHKIALKQSSSVPIGFELNNTPRDSHKSADLTDSNTSEAYDDEDTVNTDASADTDDNEECYRLKTSPTSSDDIQLKLVALQQRALQKVEENGAVPARDVDELDDDDSRDSRDDTGGYELPKSRQPMLATAESCLGLPPNSPKSPPALQWTRSCPIFDDDPCREFDAFAGDWTDSKSQLVKISPWGVIRYPNNPKLRFEAMYLGPNHLCVTFDKDPKRRKFVGKLNHDCNILVWSNDTKWVRKGSVVDSTSDAYRQQQRRTSRSRSRSRARSLSRSRSRSRVESCLIM